MSVLLEMAMFPTDTKDSKSEYVAEIINTIRESGFSYQLTPMATIIETNTMQEALSIIEQSYEVLEQMNCTRVYSTIKFDIRPNYQNRLKQKVQSIEDKIGEVSK